ncbi:MAG: tRNA guanosine(34) transglycosylase Tgt [Acidimicrobiia bacterium]
MKPLHSRIDALDGAARSTTIVTGRGSVTTPCFMPVGTRGAVKYLGAEDLEALGAQIVLGNTYHLMLRPGADLIAQFGGLNRFNTWSGHSLTDSGGFQIFSLSPKVDAEGVTFKSVYDGSSHRFTPETAVDVQEKIGADIQMVLDVCSALPSAPDVIAKAHRTTLEWAERARVVHRRDDQSLFGIVQGGLDTELRTASARHLAALEFDGYGIGGLSVGETRAEMLPALRAALADLPTDRPRYLMGVGDPASIVEAVGVGVDLFDCVLPTRLGRHGTALTSTGKIQVKGAAYRTADRPIDPACGCPVCRRYSLGYVNHLVRQSEPTAARLLTIHNVAFLLDLVADLRASIVAGTFGDTAARVLAVWG